MIQLCNRAVLTHREDGTTEFFQSDLLKKKIEESCKAAGLKETWIAEDIALAVEFSLGELGNENIFTEPEIDAIVVKILQEAGLGSVAQHYRRLQNNPEPEISFTTTAIRDVVEKYLHIEDDEQIDNIVEKVSDAGRKLLLKNTSPTLILELAKHYMDDYSYLAKQNDKSLSEHLNSCPWLVSRDSVLQKISGKTSELVASEVLKVSGISKLFPSIRIEIAFIKFASNAGLVAPVTDFTILSHLSNMAAALDDIINVAKELSRKHPTLNPDIPVYLKFTDAQLFTDEWLGGNWSESKECFEDLVTELKGLLQNSVFSYS